LLFRYIFAIPLLKFPMLPSRLLVPSGKIRIDIPFDSKFTASSKVCCADFCGYAVYCQVAAFSDIPAEEGILNNSFLIMNGIAKNKSVEYGNVNNSLVIGSQYVRFFGLDVL